MDPRSDLYSFGIVMYEMLAGRAPFQATNPHGYILKHVTEKPLPISELNPAVTVPRELEALIQRALEKNRDVRFKTAAEFATSLENVRASIPPDKKYGVGERLVTLSGAKTLADLPKYTPTGASATYSGGAKTQTGTGPSPTTQTRSGSNDQTVMERNLTAAPGRSAVPASADGATIVERLGTPGAQGAASPTIVESKWQGGQTGAEATVMERQMAPPPAKKLPIVPIAIAAVLAIAIGVGVWVMGRDDGKTNSGGGTTVAGTETSGTTINASPSLSGDTGVLLLSASPYGEIERIVNSQDKTPVSLKDEDVSTPTRIELPAGAYAITVKGPSGTQTVSVNIEAGKRTQHLVTTGSVNIDELQREMRKPQ
jgi:hypothetical protein